HRFTREGVWWFVDDWMWSFNGWTYHIPAPFDFDGASIPRVMWSLVGKHELGVISPLLHDWLYCQAGIVRYGSVTPVHYFTRTDADALFKKTMEYERVKWHHRQAGYLAVRLFGSGSWGKEREMWNPALVN